MAVAERPGVLERLGAALNTSDLSPSPLGTTSVDLIGALAYTQTNSDAAEHGELEIASINPRTELASILVRVKYGGDRALGNRAALLLVHWVQHQKAFRKWKPKVPPADSVLHRFVRQGLAEWLFPVCQECSGRTMLGLDKGEVIEKRVRCTRCHGRGWLQEIPRESKIRVALRMDCRVCRGNGWKVHRKPAQTKARECNVCLGTGGLRTSDAERANALGLELKRYQRTWPRRFSWLSSGLDRLDKLEQYCLQSQLRAGTTRT